tara:strand:+ start:104 stop:295 length:192 start_codon:yes stop_codon:yes gene_type:complete
LISGFVISGEGGPRPLISAAKRGADIKREKIGWWPQADIRYQIPTRLISGRYQNEQISVMFRG